MPQSLANVLVHIIFSTKNRMPFLKAKELCLAANGYLAGILRNLECPPLIVNSVEDHVHILCNLSRKIAIAKLLEELKKSSSTWLKTQNANLRDFHWQAGYGAFSVSQSNAT